MLYESYSDKNIILYNRGMEICSYLEDIDGKEMRRLVVKELKNYKTLCVRMKDQEEQA